MGEESKKLLGEEIKAEILKISKLPAGSQEKSNAIDDLSKLYKLKIEETSIAHKERQLESELVNFERELQHKKDQLAEQVKDRYFKIGLEAALFVGGVIFYGIWFGKHLKFEETGNLVSGTGRRLLNLCDKFLHR